MLTEAKIKKLAVKPKRYRVYDDRVTGLQVIVRPTGKKTFYLQTRIGGKLTDIKLDHTDNLTLRAAREKAGEKLIEIKNKPTKEEEKAQKIKFGEFVEERYAPYLEASHTNPKASLWILEHCFKDLLKIPMAELGYDDVQKWHTKSKGLAPATINRRIGSLKASLEKARLWGFITSNPIADWKKVKVPKEPVELLTEAQVQVLFEVLAERDKRRWEQREAYNEWRRERKQETFPDYDDLELRFTDYLTPLVQLVLNTGLRYGEAINLKWADINENVITARSSKTGSFRYVPLVSDSIADLSQLKRLNEANCGKATSNIFVDDNGKAIKSVKTAWNNIRRQLPFDCDFRMLRRTFGSRLVQKGVPVYHVSQLLGHTNVQTTQRWYLSLNLDAYKEAVRSIDDFLSV